MESIDNLREYVGNLGAELYACYDKVVELIDDVEREVAESYMRLPVDADGVPIHVGDRLEGWKHPIDEISFAATGISLDNCEGEHVTLHMLETDLRHVKPDPVKELLEEFALDIRMERFEKAELAEQSINEYADRIREVLGDDV